jgi:hypothetical protein
LCGSGFALRICSSDASYACSTIDTVDLARRGCFPVHVAVTQRSAASPDAQPESPNRRNDSWDPLLEVAVAISILANEQLLFRERDQPGEKKPNWSENNPDDGSENKREAKRPEGIAEHHGVPHNCVEAVRPKRLVDARCSERADPKRGRTKPKGYTKHRDAQGAEERRNERESRLGNRWENEDDS